MMTMRPNRTKNLKVHQGTIWYNKDGWTVIRGALWAGLNIKT